MIGIGLSGCAASNQPDISITRNIPVGQIHADPTSLTLFGEKIPFSYSTRVLLYDGSLSIDDYKANRLLGTTENGKFVFDKNNLPTYSLRFKEPSMVVGIKINDTMKIHDLFTHQTY